MISCNFQQNCLFFATLSDKAGYRFGEKFCEKSRLSVKTEKL